MHDSEVKKNPCAHGFYTAWQTKKTNGKLCSLYGLLEPLWKYLDCACVRGSYALSRAFTVYKAVLDCASRGRLAWLERRGMRDLLRVFIL